MPNHRPDNKKAAAVAPVAPAKAKAYNKKAAAPTMAKAAAPTMAKAAAPTKAKAYKGGNLTKDLASLSVPFGIILAQKGLRQFLESQKMTSNTKSKKATAPPKKKPVKASAP
jgi:hypothetical protein